MRTNTGRTSKNNTMKALILCLCITTTIAWPSGVYILGTSNIYNQYYNPLTEPHSQLDLNLRGS